MKKVWDIKIIEPLCKGCYICVEVCPKRVFELAELPGPGGFKPVVIARPDDCIGCKLCEIYCPDFAVEVRERAPEKVS